MKYTIDGPDRMIEVVGIHEGFDFYGFGRGETEGDPINQQSAALWHAMKSFPDTGKDDAWTMLTHEQRTGCKLAIHLSICHAVRLANPESITIAAYQDHPNASYDFSAFGALFYSSWCKERGCTSHDLQYMCGSEGGEEPKVLRNSFWVSVR